MRTGDVLFGTDGIRDVANSGHLRPSVILRVSQALGEVLKRKTGDSPSRRHRIALGGDTRRSLDMIRASITAGLTSLGCDLTDFGILPTPVLAHLTRSRKFDMGIMISASHNPMEDNGIKIFNSDGFKLPDDMEQEVEHLAGSGADWTPDLPKGAGIGRMDSDDTGLEEYMAHLVAVFNEYRFDGIKVAVDCANGAAWKMAPEILTRLGAKVLVMANDPDGTNINLDCGSIHPERLCERVKAEGCQIGVALDGDGDRSLFVDGSGRLLDGDHAMALLAHWMKEHDALNRSTLVTTIMSNIGLEVALRQAGIEVLRTDVGDRHVTNRLREGELSLGGEQSGHIIFGRENNYTGDGVFTACKVLSVMAETGRSLDDLASIMSRYPQVLINVKVLSKPPLDSLLTVRKKTSEARSELGNEGRVILRYSGTEKVARVMVEGRDEGRVKEYASSIADAIRNEIGT